MHNIHAYSCSVGRGPGSDEVDMAGHRVGQGSNDVGSPERTSRPHIMSPDFGVRITRNQSFASRQVADCIRLGWAGGKVVGDSCLPLLLLYDNTRRLSVHYTSGDSRAGKGLVLVKLALICCKGFQEEGKTHIIQAAVATWARVRCLWICERCHY
ncbi:hypothetical protein SUGI_1172030 [Cryptomeria japonica]|nr:hypothetical protein SUGI_1172030 [Cryptomeria japonica]